MNHSSVFVGIDVAMRKHECSIMDKDSHILVKKFTFDNTLLGYQKFINKVTTYANEMDILFGIEVTGIYGDNLFEN